MKELSFLIGEGVQDQKQLTDFFNKLDRNGDGGIDKAEFKVLLQLTMMNQAEGSQHQHQEQQYEQNQYEEQKEE